MAGGNGDNGGQQVGIGLASLVAAATALVSGLGALTAVGVIGRVQRNHGAALSWAVGLVVVGALIWLISTLFPPGETVMVRGRTFRYRPPLFAVAGLVTVLGVGLGYHASIKAANDTEQPAIEVALDPATLAVRGSATVSDLASDQRLAVEVDGLVKQGNGWRTQQQLAQSFQGPDGDGKATGKIDVGLSWGRFDAVGVTAFTGNQAGRCGDYAPAHKGVRAGGTGCVVISLPSHPNPPQLTASWTGDKTGSAVELTLRTDGTGVRDARPMPVALQVVGVRGGVALPLYRAMIAPPALGAMSRSVRLPMGKGMRCICAGAAFVRPGARLRPLHCPLRGLRSSTVELHVPDA